MLGKMVNAAVIILLLLLPFSLLAEDGMQFITSDAIQLDSTDSETVFMPFPGSGGNHTWTARSQWKTRGKADYNATKFMLILKGDSSTVSDETDSLTGYLYFLGHDGYRVSSQVFFDFANSDTAVNQDTTAWIPASRAGYVANIHLDLSALAQPAAGIELTLQQTAKDSNGTGNGMISTWRATMVVVE